jgi:ElaB/YqjD/DUF883 family membrane-anchored ribosome-binding protein
MLHARLNEARGVPSEADWQERAKEAASWAGNFIATHPIASLSAAVVLGMAIGWWVKRR